MHAQYVSESGLQPSYYIPRADVRGEVLEPSDRHTRCPKKGEASYHTLRVGDRVEEAAAWYYPEPLPAAEAIRDHIAFYFHRMDHWFEEDTEVFTHPKDIYHRIDVYPSSRHVRVSLDGELLAESTRAMALFESNLPPRWYLPREDVSAKLVPSETVTTCGYKGEANYYSVELPNGEVVKDIVWYYTDPFHDGAAVKDLLCFFNEQVDLEVDGEPHGRPADRVDRWRQGREAHVRRRNTAGELNPPISPGRPGPWPFPRFRFRRRCCVPASGRAAAFRIWPSFRCRPMARCGTSWRGSSGRSSPACSSRPAWPTPWAKTARPPPSWPESWGSTSR